MTYEGKVCSRKETKEGKMNSYCKDFYGSELQVGAEVLFTDVEWGIFTHGIILEINSVKADIGWIDHIGIERRTCLYFSQFIEVPIYRRKLQLVAGKVVKLGKEECNGE